MKKHKILFCISICAALLMSLSACSGAGAFETSDGEKESDNTSLNQKIPEGAPELVLLDGNKAEEGEIAKCAKTDGESYSYEVNTVFAYSCGTANADKKAGDSSSADKLFEGSKWGDFTVTKAEASYIIPSAAASQVAYQYLWLKGNIGFECKADYVFQERNNLQIKLEIPEETAKTLPSLKPFDNFADSSDDNDGCREFLLNPDSELSKKITEKLEAGEEVTVSLSAEEFEIRYTNFGLMTDGGTIGYLDNVTDYEIK